MRIERTISLRRGGDTPTLSVLIPTYRYDPSPLLARLKRAPAGVEVVLLDDGSGSAELLARIFTAAEHIHAPTDIIVWGANGGRVAARNRLIQAARAPYALFLDSDMLPDREDFLETWLNVIDVLQPNVAFGGLSVTHVAPTPETALHHALFANADCKPARLRAQTPAQSLATSNLLVRRDFLAAHPFDSGFVGWGFEDVEWALRAARQTDIHHVDNSATHAGLDCVDGLMRKSKEAGPNFARLAARHPGEASRFAAYRAARLMKRAPFAALWRAMFSWTVRRQSAPMALRRLAFKLHRASCYAEHLA